MARMNHFPTQKGQGTTEYALWVAFFVGIAAFLLQFGGLKDTAVGAFNFVAARLAHVAGIEMDLAAAIDKLKEVQTHYSNGTSATAQSYLRGFLRSDWLGAEDSQLSEIAGIAESLDAWSWSYYNGDPSLAAYRASNGISKDDAGLYWTTEDLTAMHLTPAANTNREVSEQSVLSYYYDSKTGNYHVIKN